MQEFHIPQAERSRSSEAFLGQKAPVLDHGPSSKAFEEMAHGFLSLLSEKKVYSFINVDDGFIDIKDFRSATTGFYMKGGLVRFQNIKRIKFSKGGRVENIAPGRIRRQRRRQNKNGKGDEDDDEDSRQPSDSSVLSLILIIIIILMLLLILFSLIVWLMG